MAKKKRRRKRRRKITGQDESRPANGQERAAATARIQPQGHTVSARPNNDPPSVVAFAMSGESGEAMSTIDPAGSEVPNGNNGTGATQPSKKERVTETQFEDAEEARVDSQFEDAIEPAIGSQFEDAEEPRSASQFDDAEEDTKTSNIPSFNDGIFDISGSRWYIRYFSVVFGIIGRL